MKKTIVLMLALAFPVSAISGAAVVTGFSESTNMVTAFDSEPASSRANTADRMSYTLPETDIPVDPFAIAAGDHDVNRHRLASADNDYLLLAVTRSPNPDLSFLDDEEDELLEVYDPLETFNRGMFWFNDKVYFWLAKPVAKGYRWITPEPFRVAVGNFFDNLATPIRFLNAGLQGKFGDAGNELVRFGTNSTIGILGLFDPSKEHFGIAKKKEDAGQTMGYYGIGPGPYLVLPFIGPSSFRDGIGFLADAYTELPPYIWDNSDYWYTTVFRFINVVALDKDTYEGIKKDALDPYLFIRDAWSQYRQNLVEN